MCDKNSRRPTKRDSSKVANLFSASSKFKNAVKLVTQKTYRRKSIESYKIIQSNVILNLADFQKYESKLNSEDQTGLALNLDMENDLENLLRKRNKSNNLVDSKGI